MLRDIEWIFFDIGYTLVNEDRAHEERIKMTLEKNSNYRYEDIYDLMVQASIEYKQPYPTAINQLGIKERERYPKEFEVPYKEAARVLNLLHSSYKIGIIANQVEGTENRLQSYGLMKYIDLVISSAEEGLEKPDIRIFNRALERANCKVINSVMVGDRLDNDIYPAKKIGMKTIWIKQGFGGLQKPKAIEYEADYTINKLEEILDIMRG